MSSKFQKFKEGNITLEDKILTNALNSETKTTNRLKSGWYIYVIIAIVNGLTTGFIGFPDIGDIASVDNISNITSGFSIFDKLFMMISTSFMMWPFFQQIFISKVNDKVNVEIHKKRELIVNNKNNTLRMGLKDSSVLFIYDIISIIILSSLIGVSLGVSLKYGTALISFFIISTLASLVILKYSRELVKTYVKNNIEKKYDSNSNDKYLLNVKVPLPIKKIMSKYKSDNETKSIIRSAINELKIIKHSHPTQEEINQALFYSIYHKQLDRVRAAIGNGTYNYHMSITSLASRNKKSDNYQLYAILSKIDEAIDNSELVKVARIIKQAKNNHDDIKEDVILNEISQFRAKILKDGTIISSREVIIKLLENDSSIGIIYELKKAELFEELDLYNANLSNKQNYKLMKKRFNDRNNFELDKLIANEKREEGYIFIWFGNILGGLNAIVNGIITAAVVGKLLVILMPILIGTTITNPLILWTTFAAVAGVGCYTSFSITRESMIKVFSKIDREIIKDTIVEKTKDDNNRILLRIAVIIGSMGLATLSGLQVFNILHLYIGNFALYAAISVATTTLIAVYSLFSDYAEVTLVKKAKNELYIEAFFQNEHNKNNVLNKIYNWNFIISVFIGIATATTLQMIYPHIVVSCTIGIFSTFFSGLVISNTTNDQYKKENINKLNTISKAGLCITLLYTGCLMASVSSAIFKLYIISYAPANIFLAITVGLIVAALYFPYVWNTATSTENNFTDTIIEIKSSNSEIEESTLKKNSFLISYTLSLTLFFSVFFVISSIIANTPGIIIASAVAMIFTVSFMKDYIENTNKLPSIVNNESVGNAATSPRSVIHLCGKGQLPCDPQQDQATLSQPSSRH
jgi:hypothetical protein